MGARLKANRILFIDIARFYAIALVFYGHFIEELMLLENPVAASQYKFIYAFYLVGIYLRRRQIVLDRLSAKILLLGAVVAFLIVLLTYQLNTGPFTFHLYNDVVVLFASHGHMLLFPLTAIAGCALVLLIAGMTRRQKTMVWLGQNTLILMCLNGIFYPYINPPVSKWMMANLPHSALSIFGVGCAMTAVSLALCIPFVWMFNRLVPQLVGKPKRNSVKSMAFDGRQPARYIQRLCGGSPFSFQPRAR